MNDKAYLKLTGNLSDRSSYNSEDTKDVSELRQLWTLSSFVCFCLL
mgnify:FL=1